MKMSRPKSFVLAATFTAANPATDYTTTFNLLDTSSALRNLFLEEYHVAGIPTTGGEPDYNAIFLQMPEVDLADDPSALRLEISSTNTHAFGLNTFIGVLKNNRQIRVRVLDAANGDGVILTYLMLRLRME